MRGEIENPMVIDSLWVNRSQTINDEYFESVIGEDLEQEVNCCICGETLYKEEAAESEIWEDTYLCGSRCCDNLHYQGWAESMELQKYYIKRKSIHRANEHSFVGI